VAPRDTDRHPKHVVRQWVEAFERRDAAGLAALYAPDAILNQPALDECAGWQEIRLRLAEQMSDYTRAGGPIRCAPLKILEDGSWGVLEWQDPLGLKACSVFHVREGRIVRQRNYWDSAGYKLLYD
jgi:ketosteroid isomerase-like protein